MRIAAIVLVLMSSGCRKSQPDAIPNVVIAPPDEAVRVQEIAPMPREIEPGFGMDLTGLFVDARDPLLRALARGEIKVGDEIGPIIERFPQHRVLRLGPYTSVSTPMNMTTASVTAKHGKAVNGGMSSCIIRGTFFNTMTRTEREEFNEMGAARMRRWAAFNDAIPAVLGVPVWLTVRWWDDR